MALVLSALESGLEAALLVMPPTGAEVAQLLADAYLAYASAGMFGASVPVFPAGSAPLVGPLAGAMVPVGTPAGFGAAWASALSALWVPAVLVTGPQNGTVVGCPGAAAVAAAVAAGVTNVMNTAGTAAEAIATALDTATRTVTATVAPPPGTILPIT